MNDLQQEYVLANGIRTHYVTVGKGPLVLLLHGFPQFWYAWRHQIPALSENFKVVVPDLRGYGETERPDKVSDYSLDNLADDAIALIHALGYEKAHIVGHDWGGAIAWKLAIESPQVVDRLVILNSPHPYIFAKALRSNLKQIRKSWYFFLFQIPYVPEYLLSRHPKNILKKLFKGTAVRKDAFTDEDIEQYLNALVKPGALTAALNYYRAAFRKKPKTEPAIKDKRISAPTLVIWGESDIALGKELTFGMEPLFKGTFRIQYVPNCSHWVMEDQPETVNSLLHEFLKS